MKIYKNLLSLIGHTPLVEIQKLNPNPMVTILAKLEMFNPGGSIKDRVGLAMIEGAERSGQLTKDKIIIEATSGNTGIGLAMVAAIKGYKVVLAMSDSVSAERKRILRGYGAELLFTPADLGTDGAIEKVYQLGREYPEKYYLTDQFNNPFNWQAHYYGTAEEIWQQTAGKVSMVVAGIGTTGTVMGISKRLKEYNPSIRVIGVEPYPEENIPGLKNLKKSYTPGIYNKNFLDEKINLKAEEAMACARDLAKKEGILAGISAGAVMRVAIDLAKKLSKGIIVVIFADSGERYLSTALFLEKPALTIRFYNTLTHKKEFFKPTAQEIFMYSCGPTVHDIPHLGVCRRLVIADLVKRFLEFKELKVKHIVNITDVDDKTITRAKQQGKSLCEITKFYTQEFFKIMEILGIKPASHYPKASEHIKEMIEITKKLLQKGYAYEKHHSIYFDIKRFSDYGKFSRINLDKIKVGLTVDLDNYEKESPFDFTLFKRCTLAELKAGIFYETQWGKVRPGWHIECVAMALKYLGETIDIHTSGKDLIFPHNENEIAIAEALTTKTFSNYWLHSELVFVNGKKMSHSAKNYITVYDLSEKGYKGKEIRYFLLATHYSKPLNFSYKGLNATRQGLSRLNNFILSLNVDVSAPTYSPLPSLVKNMEERFIKSMDDDLNISSALAAIFTLINEVNPILWQQGLNKVDREMVLSALKKLDKVLNIMDFSPIKINKKVVKLIKEREVARRNKDWPKADALRKRILSQGIEVIDTPHGPIWRYILNH